MLAKSLEKTRPTCCFVFQNLRLGSIQLLENRADMYIEAREYEKAKHDIASLRNQVSSLSHPDKIASFTLKSEPIMDELESIQLELTPLLKQSAELTEQMRPVIQKIDELYTQQRKLKSRLNEINQAKDANKSASDVLSMVADTLEEKLASHFALRDSASNQSPQRGGRFRRANRSPPLIRRGRRM
jgi:DNA repair exonuclease SbcCD ATPase subunit